MQQPAHVLGITDCSLRREASPAPPVPSVFMAAIMLRAAVFAVSAARAQRSSGACVARALSPSHRPLSDALCQPVAPWSLGLASAPAARRPTLRATVRDAPALSTTVYSRLCASGDGSHAKKMCGCGATKSDKGFCDGSHASKAR